MCAAIAPPLNLLCSESDQVENWISRETGLSSERALGLIEFGAVYFNKVRLREPRRVEAGDRVRVHVNPRRFPVNQIDWAGRVVAEQEDYLVVNKPSGIPVHPTADNFVENVLHQLRVHLKSEVFLVHRLDMATQGLMVLAKNVPFQRYLSREWEARRVTKKYRALISAPLPLGHYTHFMLESDRAPKQLSHKWVDGSKRCELQVETLHEKSDGRFEVEISLLTGRHHQIRAQLSALGVPIVGDSLYGSSLPFSSESGSGESIALCCSEIKFNDPLSLTPHRFIHSPIWNLYK